MKKKIQVLIVEDEPPTARFIKKLTEQNEKFEVVAICENAEEAVDYLEVHEHPKLLITDIRMSKMSGLDLLKVVREMDSKIKLLIISGYKMFEYAKEGIRLNIEDYITKPIDPEEFCRVLNKIEEFYKNDRILWKKECLMKAFQEKDVESAQKILENYKGGVLVIYQSASWKEDFSLFGSMTKSMLAVPYRECMFIFFVEGEEAERERKKLEIMLLKQRSEETFCMVWIDELSQKEGSLHSVYKLYEKMQKLIIPGEYRNIHKKCIEDIPLNKKWHHTEQLKNISVYIQSENWEKLEKEIDGLYKRWELEQSSLDDIKKEIYFLSECFTKLDKLREGYNFYNEEIEYCLRHADSYTGIIEKLKDAYKKLLEPVIVEKQRESKKEYSIVKSIIALVEQNMDKNYSLSEISSFYDLSQPYIRKIFKKYTNTSYNKYVQEQKILFAKQMMQRDPDILIKDIADALGYEPFYFSTVFNKNTGMTPTEYKMWLENKKM